MVGSVRGRRRSPLTDVTRRRLTLRPHPKTNPFFFFERGKPTRRAGAGVGVIPSLGTEEAARCRLGVPGMELSAQRGDSRQGSRCRAAHKAALSEALLGGVRVSLVH